MKIGETITIKGEEALKLFGDAQNGITDATLSLTLKGAKDHEGTKCGEFAITMAMKGKPQGGPALDATLKGTMLVETATSWPRKMSVTGPLKMSGTNDSPQGKIGFTGDGTMTMDMAAKYSKKK